MKIFGQVVRTLVNVVLLPIAIAKDAVTFGGIVLEDEPEIKKALRRLKDEAGDD